MVIEHIKGLFKKYSEMKYFGEMHSFLGIEIICISERLSKDNEGTREI